MPINFNTKAKATELLGELSRAGKGGAGRGGGGGGGEGPTEGRGQQRGGRQRGGPVEGGGGGRGGLRTGPFPIWSRPARFVIFGLFGTFGDLPSSFEGFAALFFSSFSAY